MANTVPVLTPMSLTGETCAQSAGVRPIPAPDPIPNSAAKIIRGVLPVAGSQRARMSTVVKVDMTIMTLKRPTLSVRALGKNRLIISIFKKNVEPQWK